MNMFDEDFARLAESTKGFGDLSVEAKNGLRALVFAAWVCGAKRYQSADKDGGMVEMAMAMLEELQRAEAAHPTKPAATHSREKME